MLYINTISYVYLKPITSNVYLDSYLPSDHVLLDLESYNLVRADHPNSVKRGGVCIYYKEFLPVRIINLPYLEQALLLELNDEGIKIIISIFIALPVKMAKKSRAF